jgi:hypothetical protein
MDEISEREKEVEELNDIPLNKLQNRSEEDDRKAIFEGRSLSEG